MFQLLLCTPVLADLAGCRIAYETDAYASALKECSPLAKQGNAQAQIVLGAMYNNGRGVPQDYKEAARWYRLAAEQGVAHAQAVLGAMYRNGRGVPQDYKEAARWYRLAAEQKEASAQFVLGAMYRNGRGVPQDYIQAHVWFNLAAASGYPNAAADRDDTALEMTPTQIAEAQRLAREWKPKASR